MEALVEGTFARLFASRVHPRDVAVQLARALEDSAAAGSPATRYTVRLNPADARALLNEHPQLAETLADELVTLAREASLTLPYRPEVNLLPDEALKPRRVFVTANPARDLSVTHGLTPLPAGSAPVPPRAFLIVEGERTVPLTHMVVNLGRRTDNDISLDDARVSRAHAQLRLRFGRYVSYDLSSSAGKSVNGRRVLECVLRPGDVISLGGVLIIYGEDEGEEIPNPKSQDSKADGYTQPNV
jgi:predicted component of type VI protein secretion system